MEKKQQTAEEGFKSALEDVINVLEKLNPHCETMEEMVGMIRLAVGDESTPPNLSQLKLLMKLVLTKR